MKTSKFRTFVGRSAHSEPLLTFCYLEAIFKNRALARDALEISLILSVLSFSKRAKIALPRGVSSKIYNDVLRNRVPAPDVLKILSIYLLKGEVLGGSF